MESLNHIITQYQLLTEWYLFALADIADQDGSKTIHENTNSLEWLAGHMIVGRFRNIVRLDLNPEPYKYIDKFINQTIPPPNAIAFDPKFKYPSLTDSREQWMKYSDMFLKAIKNASENTLKSELPFPIPTGGKTVEDALTFISLHETYHIGQMSIIRKSLGYKSMQLAPKK